MINKSPNSLLIYNCSTILSTGLALRNSAPTIGFVRHKKSRNARFDFFVENTGIEPVTSCLPGKRSSQVS
ncbi:MAG: hypothetical protein RIT03_381 [Bacteroidota bacterium]